MTASRSTLRPPAPGTRCVLAEPVERSPHYIAAAGATGTVVHADEYTVRMHMDDYLPGAEKCDLGIPSANPSAIAAFQRTTKLLNDDPLV